MVLDGSRPEPFVEGQFTAVELRQVVIWSDRGGRREMRLGHFSQGAFVLMQAAQPVRLWQWVIEQRLELGECALVDSEERLIEQHVFRLTAGGFKHEIRPAATQAIRGLVDQVALTGLGADIDGNGKRFSSLWLGHGQAPCVHMKIHFCIRKIATRVSKVEKMLTATGNRTASPTGKRADNDGDARASAGLARARKRDSLSRLSPAPKPTAGRLQKTIDDIVRFTMALPEVEENTSWGKPALKRRGKLLFLLRDAERFLVCLRLRGSRGVVGRPSRDVRDRRPLPELPGGDGAPRARRPEAAASGRDRSVGTGGRPPSEEAGRWRRRLAGAVPVVLSTVGSVETHWSKIGKALLRSSGYRSCSRDSYRTDTFPATSVASSSIELELKRTPDGCGARRPLGRHHHFRIANRRPDLALHASGAVLSRGLGAAESRV